MATLRLFAQARELAGVATVELDGATVGEVLDQAVARFGPSFAAVVDASKVWVNGAGAQRDSGIGPDDEVAVLPPVSGG